MRRRFFLLVPVVLVFVVAGVALFRVRPGAELGGPVADFTLPSVRDPDRTIRLSEHVGRRPVVLNFWASWCEPCKEEAPEFRRVAIRYADDVTFLGVSILDGPGPAGRFMEEAEIPYESVSDVRGVTAKRFGMTGVPETVFVDREGLVVGRYIGALERGQLADLVERLVALEPGERLEVTGRGRSQPVP